MKTEASLYFHAGPENVSPSRVTEVTPNKTSSSSSFFNPPTKTDIHLLHVVVLFWQSSDSRLAWVAGAT